MGLSLKKTGFRYKNYYLDPVLTFQRLLIFSGNPVSLFLSQ